MTSLPKRVNPTWIDQQTRKLNGIVAVLKDGTPNPSHAELAAEIEAAKVEQARWDAFAAWATQKLAGARLNDYPFRTQTQTHQPGTVFVAKVDGQTKFWTVAKQWEKYQAETGNA